MKTLNIFYKYFLIIIVVFVLLFSLISRYFGAISGLPDYDITEVPVVAHALSFAQGDLRPTWHSYGPLYSYLLAIVYVVISFLSGINIDVFVQDSFFNPSFYYFIARIFATDLSIVLAGLLYFCAKKIYDKKVALVALVLGVFPFVDNITGFLVKIDVLLAVWALLTVYSSVKIYQTKKIKYYVITGLFLGLGLATKPLTALLVMPTILLSCFLAQEKKSFFKRAKHFFVDKKLYLLFLSGVFFNFLFNPYSLLKFNDYISWQIHLIGFSVDLPLSKGYSILLEFANANFLGLFFVIIAILSLQYYLFSYLKKKDGAFAIVASYPVVYFSAFAFTPILRHLLIPIIPVVILMISKFIIDISSGIEKHWLRALFIIVILFSILYQPTNYLLKNSLELKEYIDEGRGSSTVIAKNWIESNIPKMSKIFIYGLHADLPRIIDYRSEVHMNIIDDIAYGLGDKPLYLRSYKRAYEKLKEEKDIFYELEDLRVMNYKLMNKLPAPGEELSKEEVFNYIMKNDFDYVITSFKYSLDYHPKLKIIKNYNSDDYGDGRSFSIYKIKD